MAMITSGQREAVVNVVISAARSAGDEVISELSESGVLTDGNSQRVVAQGDRIKAVVKAVVKKTLAELAENVVGVLKRIFADRVIELAEANGTETLAEAKDVFKGGIYGATKRGSCRPTKKAIVTVWQMILDATYRTTFGGFGENLKRLCWTEAQIVAICRDHRDILRRDGYGTFFLFEGENSEFYVAFVNVDVNDRLYVRVYSLDVGYTWYACHQHLVVVPQL